MFTVTLNNGLKCPIIGLGTWQASDNQELVGKSVKEAIDAGYRHFDSAFIYHNEEEVGEAIREKIAEGAVKREELFITTKLWNTFHKEGQVVPACKLSLKNLGLDYVDLFLMHWPTAYTYDGVHHYHTVDANGKSLIEDTDYLETWRGMEECVRLGLTKSIGVSNCNSEQVGRILSIAKIKPVINQVECHINLNQKKLRAFCEERGVKITAHSPLGSPKRPWAQPGDHQVSLKHPVILKIAKKYKKSPAQVILRFMIDNGIIVIPKSSSKQRIIENIEVFDFHLNSEELNEIDKLDMGARICPALQRNDHPDYPFNIEF